MTSKMTKQMQTDLDHYSGEGASNYQLHHGKNMRTRLTSARELSVLRRALRVAAPVEVVLDLPCGTGRFWPEFEKAGVARLIAADASAAMLGLASSQRASMQLPVELLQTSAFDIDLPDNAVDFVACMRFLHHLSVAEDREMVLAELGRVTRKYVAISLWVDGNLQSLRQENMPLPHPGYGKRICRTRTETEQEFQAAGFDIVCHFDVWPWISMWRLYLLSRTGS